MSTAGAVRAAQHVYDSTGLMGDYVMVARDHYTVVGRDEDGHTRLHDVPRTGRVHDAVTQVSESLDALFRSFRLGTRNTNQPGRGRDSMTFPQRSMITEMRGGHDTFADAPPVILNVRDSGPARKRTKPEPEREPEDELLAHLDGMGAALMRLFPEHAVKLVTFDQEVRALVEARRKARESGAREQFDALTAEGRTALAKVEKLEAERNELQQDRNRAIAVANGAKQRRAAVERAKPQDADFPTREEVAAWQQKLAAARAEVAETQQVVDELQAASRSKGAELAIAKSELSAIREKRNAARRQFDPNHAPAEADNESETLRVL